jgi:tRNA threonylcarbamoyladenosine biosynthesis protein TsaE
VAAFTFRSDSLTDTAALGSALAEVLPDGSVVVLSGTLGAGKTQLVQAVAAASGVNPRDVTSPTFVLINEYRGRRLIYHFDAYRIRDDDEFLQLGPEEYFDAGGLTFIEWAERVENCLPPERLEIRVGVLAETSRRFELTAVGKRYQAVLEQLVPAVQASARPEAQRPASPPP